MFIWTRRVWGCENRPAHGNRRCWVTFSNLGNEDVKTEQWRVKAACQGLDPTIFYPADDNDEQADAAKAVCAVCPVQGECLEYALGSKEREGVWGGATERERRRIVRQRRRAAYADSARRSA